MTLFKANWNPGDRQLRQFGLIVLVALPALGWMFTSPTSTFTSPFTGDPVPTRWAAIGTLACLGIVCSILGWLWPGLLKPVFVGLTVITLPIGIVVGECVMSIVYFGVFSPIAFIFRIVGRDALHRQFERNRTSYWQTRSEPGEPETYLRQY